MSTHKHFDKICCIILAAVLALSVLFMNGAALGIQTAVRVMGYESRLFDYTHVHTIDLVAENWEDFLTTCTNEEYIQCAAVIDGEAYRNIAIRAKGNTSLSSVKQYGNDRYSFKLEFDHFDSSLTYHGLDKLCLNNIIQDNTYMKDFIVYQMMGRFGVSAPLCSFAYITINGEDWGLYLAVEAVEDSFLQRNYGADYGELYKPDSMSFGGGRGNGEGFDMEEFRDKYMNENGDINFGEITDELPDEIKENIPENFDPSQFGGFTPPDGGNGSFGEGFDPSQFGGISPPDGGMMFPETGGNSPEKPDGMAPPDWGINSENGSEAPAPNAENGQNIPDNGNAPADNLAGNRPSNRPAGGRGDKGGFGGGMGAKGSTDVKLQYTDDNPDSYKNIFDSAKTDISDADKTRLIDALKRLNEGDISAVNLDEVYRYFVVHLFVCNGDSYTGNMIHNYYLYEKDGAMSMLPWDYNLAFGGFDGNQATSSVNSPIDTPVSGGIGVDRPMISWIFSDEQYTQQYHEYFRQFIAEVIDSGWAEELIDSTAELIAPYVERDPTKFCTCEEFEKGVSVLREFISLRGESVSGQLDGTIPSTTAGQSGSDMLVDATHINISEMGSMAHGGDRGNGGGFRNEMSSQKQERTSPVTTE